MTDDIQRFCNTYQLYEHDAIQHVQLRHRYDLVQSFQLKEGMHILEIGCGQGDTTVLLADAVGATGHVTALDIAKGDYGAPFTLTEAHARIQASPLGKRISFHVETDFLDYPVAHIDAIVLSHSSWYFQSKEQLLQYFQRAKQLGVKLYFAEWDVAYTRPEQRSHFCAVSILALYSAFVENDGNIQHVWSKGQIAALATTAGFQIEEAKIIEADYLQDGQWERAYANAIADEFTAAPSSIQALVQAYVEVMNIPDVAETASLHSFMYIFV